MPVTCILEQLKAGTLPLMEAKRLPGEGLKADARAELWVLMDSLKHYHLVIDLHHVWQQSRVSSAFQLIVLGHSTGIMVRHKHMQTSELVYSSAGAVLRLAQSPASARLDPGRASRSAPRPSSCPSQWWGSACS